MSARILPRLSIALAVVALGCNAETPQSATLVPPVADSAVDEPAPEQPAVEEEPAPADSHAKGAAPAWDTLFALDRVHRIDIAMPGATYQQMLDDLDTLLGSSGGGAAVGGPAPGKAPPAEAVAACSGSASGASCTVQLPNATVDGACQEFADGQLACVPAGKGPGGGAPPGGGQADGGGPGDLIGADPVWVPVTVTHEGLQWQQVGMRFKGNSSLRSTWQRGGRKFGFRLTFDKFEDQHPETQDQRFHGFKKMTFAPGFGDGSMMRDVLASELLREHGVVAAHAAFYEVWVDLGDGPTYWGLYTMLEDPSDQLPEAWFDDDDGNVYKPDGPGADFTTFIADGFDKKTNEDDADWSDVEAAISALHADRSDPGAWRAALEDTFDVDGFLRWLAANQAMENWDTYGAIAHNYYLYGDPSRGGLLTWIPWDHNESLKAGKKGDDTLTLQNTGDKWPLIRFLLDDDVYHQAYLDHLQAFVAGPYDPQTLFPFIEQLHEMIAPYVVAEAAPYTQLNGGVADFEGALETGKEALFPHIEARRAAAAAQVGVTNPHTTAATTPGVGGGQN